MFINLFFFVEETFKHKLLLNIIRKCYNLNKHLQVLNESVSIDKLQFVEKYLPSHLVTIRKILGLNTSRKC